MDRRRSRWSCATTAPPAALREVDGAYDPVLRGSLITDLAGAARRAGYEAAVATLTPDSLIDLLSDGVPPILLYQNGSGPVTFRHFGVVTGWDASHASFTLHDGGARPRVTGRGDLVKRWETAGSQALIVRQGCRDPVRGPILPDRRRNGGGHRTRRLLAHRGATRPADGERAQRSRRGVRIQRADEPRGQGVSEVLRLDSHQNRAWVNLGNVEAAEVRWRDAEKSYRRALRESPTDPDAMNNLAIALLRQGRNHDEARALAEFAVALGGERDSIYRTTLAEVSGSVR